MFRGPDGSLSIDDEASAVPDAYGDVVLSRDRHRRLRRRLLVEVDRKWKIDRGSETILLGDGCRQMPVIALTTLMDIIDPVPVRPVG